MKDGVLEVKVHQVVPTNNGCAVFIGNQQKVFIIYVDQSVGMTIHMLMRGIKRERPLTHDLIGNIFAGLGVRVERVVVNDLKHDERGGTYYARLILCAENELGKKIVEIDARPSDSIALALQQKCPIYVAKDVFEQVEDASEVLKRVNQSQKEGGDPSEPDFGGEEEEKP